MAERHRRQRKNHPQDAGENDVAAAAAATEVVAEQVLGSETRQEHTKRERPHRLLPGKWGAWRISVGAGWCYTSPFGRGIVPKGT